MRTIARRLALAAGLLALNTPLSARGEESGKVAARTLLVVDDPDGGAMTRQLTQSAALLFATMADPQDEVGLYARAATPIRRSPEPITRALGGLRRTISAMSGAQPADYAEVVEFLAAEYAEPRPHTRNAVVVLAFSPRDGEAKPTLEASATRQLEKWKVPVFVVAFGKRAEPEAYRALTEPTGGRGFQVLRGADLKSAFNSIHAKLHDGEGLPVVGDRLVLDDSIQEATVVVPKSEPGKVRIITPSKRILVSRTKYPGVKWETFEEYDLVRIENPEAGTWRIRQPGEAEGGIVGRINASDVRMFVRVGPRSPMVGDSSWIEAHLEEKGRVLDSYSLLKHLVIEAQIRDPSGRMHPVRLERGEAGRFRAEVVNEMEGYHELTLTAYSPEIQRERKMTFRVNPSCFIGELSEGPPPRVTIHMSPSCPRFAELYARLVVEQEGEVTDQTYFERVGRQLRAVAPAPELGQAHTLRVEVEARTMDGHEIESAAGGPYEVAARDPTLADYVAAVGKRLVALNVPVLVGVLGVVAIRRGKKPKKLGRKVENS